jgi:hypothetical protein
MASLIGWIVVGLVSVGTLIGVVGIAVTSVMLATRKVGELFGRRAAAATTAESATERTPAHAA